MTKKTTRQYCYDYPRPAVTVDIVLLRAHENSAPNEVLLIKREKEPFEGRWALPGGFINKDEALEDAAARELREETGLMAEKLELVSAFGKPGRDPRGHTVSIAFVGLIGPSAVPIAGDDAKEVGWHSIDALPELAFDHSEIIATVMSKLNKHA